MPFDRTSQPAFFGTSALLFAASAALTTVLVRLHVSYGRDADARRLDDVDGMDAMPGDTWLGAAASFIGMWVVMMVAMMLPSFVPTLWRYRQSVGKAGELRLSWLTALVGIGYFVVWTVFGIVVFPLGATLAEIEMQRPALAKSRSDRGRRCRRDRRRTAIQCVEGASPCLLPGDIAKRAFFAGGRCHGLATRATARPSLHLQLRCLYGDPPRHRGDGSAGDGACHGSNHCGTSRIE